MKSLSCVTPLLATLLLPVTAAAQGAKPLTKCAPDAVISGTVCMDRYEASVWRVPDPAGANKGLAKRITQGKATREALLAGGATQLGLAYGDLAPCGFAGENCADIYAVSLEGIVPSGVTTYFQAQQACKNARKRLPSNAEWQAAAAGTPDATSDNGTTDCNSQSAGAAVETGSRSSCVSPDGAFDMVGNLAEWVADWVPRSTGCGNWDAGVSPLGEDQCLVGAATTGEPGVLVRGGDFADTAAGPLAVLGFVTPASSGDLGFRCAR